MRAAALRHAAADEEDVRRGEGHSCSELLPRLASGELDETDLQIAPRVRRRADDLHRQGLADEGSLRSLSRRLQTIPRALDKHTPEARSPPPPPAKPPNWASSCSTSPTTSPTSTNGAKAREGKLDFDDLLVPRVPSCSRIPNTTRSASGSPPTCGCCLVDEFQDTDRLQVELVKALCGDVADGKLFFVGDMNQSIYRFRGAQPDVFHDLRDQIPKPGQLPLTQQFSQPAGDAEFRQRAVRARVRRRTTSRCAPTARKSPPSRRSSFSGRSRPTSGRPAASSDARAQEARRIARRLRELIDSEDADHRRRRRPPAANAPLRARRRRHPVPR